VTEDIVRKIGKLLETADSFQEVGNQEAAESYIAKAMELMTKYNIDQTMLAARGEQAADTLVTKTVVMAGGFGRRRIHLAHYVALANDCRGTFGRQTPYTTYTDAEGKERRRYNYDAPQVYNYSVFGFSRDVDWVVTLCERLNAHLTSNLARDMKDKPRYENHKTWGTEYVEAYASTIYNRLLAAKREARQQAETEQADRRAEAYAHGGEEALQAEKEASVALVLADKSKRVEEEFRARNKGGRSSSTSSGYSRSAREAGKAAGNSASLGRAVGGGSKGSLGR
jgi:hypothetical protein